MTAALCGVAQLPPALKIRPIGAVQATIAAHPGMEVLENAGICQGGEVDPSVASWVRALGRPDVEIDVTITRPEIRPERLEGPPAVFTAPEDAIEAAEALARWYAQRPPQRVVTLCRRDNAWVAAARLWRPGQDTSDEVVVTPLGGTEIAHVVVDTIGPADPAQFHGINSEAAVLNTVLSAWQANPAIDIIAGLVEVGLSVPQARLVEAVADRGTTRAVIGAAEFSISGPARAPMAVTVADTLIGRVVVSNSVGPDGRQWTTLLPGADHAIHTAVVELLETLPSGRGWATHQRT
ncbi:MULTISPECIES: ESX secretion-associated protein EspG [Mycobacteriaceae]|uniref:ESX secretion-associated protein EspG n=1 Tax=Mycobacterium kubicae TaxID=120959 RepID=A0AAX1J7K5_9MYCO|nr:MULTISPECIES: ESX secretion-associated protein EspG [Mycobacteriaceae]MCV7007899.1 ESX secretion-associated protein EspG [Mycobacterium gordonae]MCV7094380.1 ESX secretion-associated protein EspG [Mycobacterium kubicae]MCV7120823.1 ESX secretion-associated protein EspG [Mycobacterium nebraskense]QPI37408.1 ESX secretion-associated protein EspG [Mycobacterium kubicae]